MIEHYKRLVSLVLGMHDEQIAEDGAHNPSGVELEAILLASHIRELEDNQDALNQKESPPIKITGCAGMEQWIYDCAGEIVDLTKLDTHPETWGSIEARLGIGKLIPCSVYNNLT